MQKPDSSFSYLIGIIGSNILISGMFFSAILLPEKHADFILRTAIMIFVLELFGWIVTGFTSLMIPQKSGFDDWFRARESSFGKYERLFHQIYGKAGQVIGGIIFIPFFGLMLFLIGYNFKNILTPALVFVSIVVRFFKKKSADYRLKQLILFLFVFIPSTILAAIFAPYVQTVFPIPSEMIQEILSKTDGFEERPLWFMVWGIIYYFLVAVAEFILFLRSLRYQGTVAERPFWHFFHRKT